MRFLQKILTTETNIFEIKVWNEKY
jgi:hypothetical protein